MYAHYFKTKAGCFLILSNDMRPCGPEIAVSGKKEARAIAKEYNATCWNF